MSRDDRVFVSNGRRHFRRRYSPTELRIGLVVLAGLILLVVWVGWKGAHPDPTLFGEGVTPAGGGSPTAAPAVDRGVLPAGLATPGWTEGKVSQFGQDNLYEKINGREGYYKALGFQQLTFLSLVDDANPARVVDIELFDQGEAGNALGAYAGERPAGVRTEISDAGLGHLDRNALLVTRGRYYLRAIGSDESPETQSLLRHIREVVEAGLPGEPLPYGYAFFVGLMGFDPGQVAFLPENAFSFGFANNVYSVLLDDEETELWLTLAADEATAKALATEFTNGFLSYGSEEKSGSGVRWVEDRYIHAVSGATHRESWVCGVRGAPALEPAEAALKRLEDALDAFSVDNRPQPAPVPEPASPTSDEYETGGEDH